MSRRNSLSARGLIGLLGIIALAGCNTMTGDSLREPIQGMDTRAMRAEGYSFDDQGLQKPVPNDSERPSVVLEVRDGERHLERIPLPESKPTFVQDIVDDAKLIDRLGKIQVTLMRPTGNGAPPIRMECDFDPDTRRIVVGQNYAIQPNDQLLVTKDQRSWLDQMNIFSPRASK